MRNLFIDLETFSGTDIKSAGNYKYCEDSNFEILLCGYMFDTDTDVSIIDLTSFDGRKCFDDLFYAVSTDTDITVVAHNANFERVCLKEYGYKIDPMRLSVRLTCHCTADCRPRWMPYHRY